MPTVAGRTPSLGWLDAWLLYVPPRESDCFLGLEERGTIHTEEKRGVRVDGEETDRQRQTDTDRYRQTQTETDRYRQRHRQTDRDRQTDRQTDI